jgi:hypothetical protein
MDFEGLEFYNSVDRGFESLEIDSSVDDIIYGRKRFVLTERLAKSDLLKRREQLTEKLMKEVLNKINYTITDWDISESGNEINVNVKVQPSVQYINVDFSVVFPSGVTLDSSLNEE